MLGRLKALAIALCVLSAGCCSELFALEPWKPTRVVATASIKPGAPACVTVRVGSTDRLFLVDTGASMTVIDIAILARGTLPVRKEVVHSANRLLTLPMYLSPSVYLGECPCDWLTEVGGIDLSYVRLISGRDVTGILGMDAMRRFVLHLDFDNGVLLLCEPATGKTPPGVALPLRRTEFGCPTIELQSARGDPITFQIDTGNHGGAMLEARIADALLRGKAAKPTGIRILTVDVKGLSAVAGQIRCAGMKLGEFRHPDLVFNTANSNLLGVPYLSRYRTTFDFTNDRAYFERSAGFRLRDRSDYLGLSVSFDNPACLTVNFVAEESAAADAGFRLDDEILTIDGIPVRGLPPAESMRLLTMPRREEVTFLIRRGVTSRKITVPGG